MKIFYRESDNKFCGAVNVDKKIAGDGKINFIEVPESDWVKFLDTASEIYVEKGNLVSKKYVQTKKENIDQQLHILKSNLKNTDKESFKYIDGQLSEEKYAPIKKLRIGWRKEIDSIEKN